MNKLPEIIEFLKKTDTPTVSNAIEKLTVRNRVSGFCSIEMKHLTPDAGIMCAYAVTAHVQASSPDVIGGINDRFMDLCRMIEQASKPVVVVFQDVGAHGDMSAHCGEVMAVIFKKLGAVGVVSDSGVRDILEVNGLGFQYFARGLVASHGSFEILRVGQPVNVCGLQIETGDLLHGDDNGLIKVPAEGMEKLPGLIKSVRDAEKKIMDYAGNDDFSLDGLNDIFSH